jgi:hypothetical protein
MMMAHLPVGHPAGYGSQAGGYGSYPDNYSGYGLAYGDSCAGYDSAMMSCGGGAAGFANRQGTANPDYFAVGMRPCLTQFPPWLHQVYSDCSGRVHLSLPGDSGRQHTGGSTTAGDSKSGGSFAGGSAFDDQVSVEIQADSKAFPRGKPITKLHEAFDAVNDVQSFDPNRFELKRDLQDAPRNKGKVSLMWDTIDKRFVAAKTMPNSWAGRNHVDFMAMYPQEIEWPWQDIGCTKFLNEAGFPHGCTLLGVHRDRRTTAVMTSFASEGDLFTWCGKNGTKAGPEREDVVRPLAAQLFQGMKHLHELSIVHRDLSMENCLVSKNDEDGSLHLQIIDFGMAQTQRYFSHEVRGKKSYQAPECHGEDEYDAFLADTFACGVSLYCILVMDYPWQSTQPGSCKCFDFVRKYGFRAYLHKRKLRNSDTPVSKVLSEPAKKLLAGLLELDPEKRLTLGENGWWKNQKRSVWDEEWLESVDRDPD